MISDNKEIYIILYNGECDYIIEYSAKNVEREIKNLVEDEGFNADDIRVIKGKEIYFEAGIKAEIKLDVS